MDIDIVTNFEQLTTATDFDRRDHSGVHHFNRQMSPGSVYVAQTTESNCHVYTHHD